MTTFALICDCIQLASLAEWKARQVIIIIITTACDFASQLANTSEQERSFCVRMYYLPYPTSPFTIPELQNLTPDVPELQKFAQGPVG